MTGTAPAAARLPSVVVLTEPGTRRYTELPGSPLCGHAQVQRLDWTPEADRDGYLGAVDVLLADADALVVSPWSRTCVPPFTAERWGRAPRLKVIAGTFDNRFAGWLEIADAAQRGVTVVDTSRSMTPTVAEYALAMILNLLRDIPAAVQLVRGGGWRPDTWDQPGFVHGDLTGRRVGLVGYGSINQRLTELLAPFGCEVRAYDPYAPGDRLDRARVTRVATLTGLAASSEILMIAVPPTAATRGLVSREVIGALPTGALLVLVSRMAVVDQEALWQRAHAGQIRVAVDVFDPEPPPVDAPFRRNPRVIPTPHIAGATTMCHRRCFTTACADALAVLSGQAPRYPVTIRDDHLYRGRTPDS